MFIEFRVFLSSAMKTQIFHGIDVCFCFIAMGIFAYAQVVVDNSFGNVGILGGLSFKIRMCWEKRWSNSVSLSKVQRTRKNGTTTN